MENFEQLLDSVRQGNGLPAGMSAMDTIPSLLRGAFRAWKAKRFVASDLSQIELRVLAWLTNCGPMLEAFALDQDLYIAFAAEWFQVPYEEIERRIKIDKDPVAKLWRQISKPAVLSCGYGSGGGEWKAEYRRCQSCVGAGCENCNKSGRYKGLTSDLVKTGLWGYAESMGVKITQEQAHEAVAVYRDKYREVVYYWYNAEDAIRRLLETPSRNMAPGTEFVSQFGRIELRLRPGKLLRVKLPSGRFLHYIKPELDEDGNITYETELQPSKVRGRRRLYGSLFTENLVQAIARDVMAVGMVRAADAGFEIVGHTHDELLTMSPIDSRHNLTLLNSMMVGEISWCADLPLKSEGWEGEVYRK